MSEFILDTNVLSELWKPNPNPNVAAWVELADWYLPAPVIAEMQEGASGCRVPPMLSDLWKLAQTLPSKRHKW